MGRRLLSVADERLRGLADRAAELAPHYARAAALLGLDQSKDALERAYPLIGPSASDASRNPGSPLERLLARWRERDAELAAAGLTPGRARLAVRRDACTRCGLCFYGCAFGAIWNAGHPLDGLAVRYRPGCFVQGFREEAGGVRVHGREGDAALDERYDALLLAAGVLSSLRIAADSLGLHDRPVPLLDNDLYLLPVLAPGARPAWGFRSRFTLGEAVLAIEAGVVSQRPLHVQLYSFHEFFLAELGDLLHALPGRAPGSGLVGAELVRAGLRVPAGRGLDARDRARRRRREGARPRAHRGEPERGEPRHPLATARASAPTEPPARLLAGARAGEEHPLRLPRAPGRHATDAREPGAARDRREWPPLRNRARFVVDPAAFPTLPAQNLTFTAMANAMRVADGIAEQLS